jgi:hypothetical protein
VFSSDYYLRTSSPQTSASPTPSPDAPQTGGGFGWTGGATLEGGVYSGLGANGAIGFGALYNGSDGFSLTGFGSGGTMSGNSSSVVNPEPGPGSQNVIFGGYGSVSPLGLWFTNAGNTDALRGPFSTVSANFGYALAINFQFSTNGPIWFFSASVGGGLGGAISQYPTTTGAFGFPR